MKMYIGDADFLYKSLVKNCDAETLECIMNYIEFQRHINSNKIVSCNGIAYMRCLDALTKNIQKSDNNIIVNLAVNLN
jgi:hypothetical protein